MIHLVHRNFRRMAGIGIGIFLMIIAFTSHAQKNVGINTTNPQSTLEIQAIGTTNANSALNVTNEDTTSLFFIRNDGRIGVGTKTPGARFMVVGEAGAPTMNVLHDGTNGMNPALRVNDNGRVGIGTTSPGARFMVVGEAGAPTMNVLHDGTNGMNPALRVNDNGRVGIGTTSPGARFMVVGEAGAPTMNVLHDGTNGMNPALRINDNGRVGIGTTSPGARFMVVGQGGGPTLNVLHDGTAPMNPALRVNEDGNVGIGTTIPAYRLDVDGDINASGVLRVNGVMVSSDKRYKNRIISLANSLAIIGQLRGTKYFLNNSNISEEEQFGFIAQEIERVLPNLVVTDRHGYKAVNYVGLIPVLTEGIKEQQNVIEEQSVINEKQAKEIEDLKARLEKIEALIMENK